MSSGPIRLHAVLLDRPQGDRAQILLILPSHSTIADLRRTLLEKSQKFLSSRSSDDFVIRDSVFSLIDTDLDAFKVADVLNLYHNLVYLLPASETLGGHLSDGIGLNILCHCPACQSGRIGTAANPQITEPKALETTVSLQHLSHQQRKRKSPPPTQPAAAATTPQRNETSSPVKKKVEKKAEYIISKPPVAEVPLPTMTTPNVTDAKSTPSSSTKKSREVKTAPESSKKETQKEEAPRNPSTKTDSAAKRGDKESEKKETENRSSKYKNKTTTSPSVAYTPSKPLNDSKAKTLSSAEQQQQIQNLMGNAELWDS